MSAKEFVDRAIQCPSPQQHDIQPVIDNERVESRRPAVQKFHLPYNKPPFSTPSNRISSLPETSSPHRLNSARISSLPDRIPVNVDNSVEHVESSTDGTCSMSFSSASRSRISLPRYTQTPSPPSSPDSVMIIGTDNFFRPRKPQVCPDDGWVDWANSPPKPIPALHGPLSLPYARCPSGAEGTIVEGEDLSRMIWGLGLDDAIPKINSTQTNKPFSSQPASGTASESRPRAPTRFDEVITLSQDHLFHPSSALPPRPIVGDTNFSNRFEHLNNGLGLDWQTLQRLSINNPPKAQTILKSSAPAFVPASQGLESHPRIFIEPRHGQSIAPSRPMSALELARQYQAKQLARAASTLPTPPNSASPKWTATFNDPFPQSKIDPFGPGDFLDEFYPNRYGAADDEFGDFVHENIIYPQKKITSSVRSLQRPSEFNFRDNYNYETELAHSYPGPPPNSPLPPIPKASHHDFRNRMKAAARLEEDPASPPGLVLHSAPPLTRQPRSIPFARMMQRRLSAVPEEETFTESQTPAPLQRDNWLRGPSSPSNPFSSRLPDISNSVHSRTPSPDKAHRRPLSRTGRSDDEDPDLKWRRLPTTATLVKKDRSRTRKDGSEIVDKENGSTSKTVEAGPKKKKTKNKKPVFVEKPGPVENHDFFPQVNLEAWQ
ncbi:hypothetical protein C8J56DRAFT_455471 [Mycena floridula]|nr:hypothetical protein C8J56DRAFT_455471 [Mycena floridula]